MPTPRRHPPDAARRSRGRGAAYRGPRVPPPVRSLVVILVYDFGVDDVVIVVARAVRSRCFGPGGTLGALCSGRLLLGVQGLADLLAGLAQRGLGRFHGLDVIALERGLDLDRKSTRLNSSHVAISYAVFCLKKKRYEAVWSYGSC